MDRRRPERVARAAGVFVVGCVAGSAPGGTVEGTVGCDLGKLTASDADALDGFGEHLVARGDVAIVGAWNDDGPSASRGARGGFAYGSAYVLRRDGDTWTEEQKLIPSDPTSEQRFGHDVAIDGDDAIVSAVGADDFAGAVYFFHRTDGIWSDEQRLQPSGPADQFGFSVAIDGNVAIVGANGDDDACGPGCDAGAAYIYRRVAGVWNLEAKLVPDDLDVRDYFGWSVAIRGDTALVGSRTDDDLAKSSGSVWVFRHDGEAWTEAGKLHASDGAFGDFFGHALALGDGVAVVGAIFDDDACPGDVLCNSGSAYVFRRNGDTWQEEAKLTSADAAADDEFGHAVAIDGDVVVVGVRFDDDACPADPDCRSGSAYVFRREDDRWNQAAKLVAFDTAATDFFGVDVAVAGDHALVGSYLDDDDGPASGSVYVYGVTAEACACREDLDGSGAVDFGDILAVLTAWGAAGGPEDLDGSGFVDFGDLLAVLAAWGACPAGA